MERAPSQKAELLVVHLVPDAWNELSRLERTGWVKRGVKNPETVAEHILSLKQLARELAVFRGKEQEDLLLMLEIHDWPEALHGDEVIVTHDKADRGAREKIKFENEQRAMKTICEPLGEKGAEILSLWLRFETSNDEVAIFARELDKYQAVEKALYYETTQGVVVFAEFLEYSREFIHHPVLLVWLAALEEKATQQA
jgi:putative hydrolase of HD superfamily